MTENNEKNPRSGRGGTSKRGGFFGRGLRAIAWRTFWRTEIKVFCARAPSGPPVPPPADFQLIKLDEDRDRLVERSMRAAGEPENLVEARFRKGDLFFGWMRGSAVVSFGWVTFSERQIGRSVVPAAPDWAFLYNFYTIPGFRGQGLYPQLLTAIIKNLTKTQPGVVIIDVNSRNNASLRGIEKAGFILVGTTSWVTVLRFWNCSHYPLRLDRIPSIIFG